MKAAHPLYETWRSMRKRCSSPNRRDYKWYGAKGVTVCPEWESFEQFVEDMFPTWRKGLTLEREDRTKGYSKDNCTWKTIQEQQKNRGNVAGHWKRLEEVKSLKAKGFTQVEIAALTGMSQPTVSRLLRQ